MKWKERNIMQFLPLARASEGCGALSFSALDEALILLPAGRTPKAGFIMWSSTVCLIEILNLGLSPASTVSGVLRGFQSQTGKLLYNHANYYTPDGGIVYKHGREMGSKQDCYTHLKRL